MKKLVVLMLVIMLAGAVAFAEIDLSGMSFDELVALKDQINMAIWQSQDWQEVTVPQGLWVVGEDIPAGMWTVKCADFSLDDFMMGSVSIEIGDSLTESGGINLSARYDSKNIYNPNASGYDEGKITEYTFDLKDGDYVLIHTSGNQAIFTPYAGKPSLGFK